MEKVLIFLKNFKFETKIYVKITLQTFQKKGVKMYKAFFRLALLGALTANLSLADDFLARATNGALSDNSVGVKKLTADEASKVVGGYNAQFVALRNISLGNVSVMEMAAVAILSSSELRYKGVCNLGATVCTTFNANGQQIATYSANTRYKELSAVADPTKNQFVAFSVTQTYSRVNPYRPTITHAVTNMVLGVTSSGAVYKVRSNIGFNRIVNEMRSSYEKTIKNYLATQIMR